MQDIENNMDELFQRAGEDYPLKADKGDWEIISKKLAGGTAAEANPSREKRHYLLALLLLLFIFSGILVTYLLWNGKGSEVACKKAIVSKEQKKDAVDYLKKGVGSKEPTELKPSENDSLAEPILKEVVSAANKYSKSVTTVVRQNFYSQSPELSVQPTDPEEQGRLRSIELPHKKSPSGMNKAEYDNEKAVGNIAEAESMTLESESKIAPALSDSVAGEQTTKLKKTGALYAGVIAGPDYSRVKEMSFGNPGFTAGLLVGYHLNRHFSLESGVSWNRKYFTSQGKDFQMDKMGGSMPAGMVIDNLESQTGLIEIPLNLKYDFLTTKKSAFFFTAGMSAYIMTKEKNMYTVTYNGNQQKMEGIYNKADYGFPAVANFSAGFQHNISPKLKIRIAPYVKIPLQGMGMGSLPVTSAGLHLGITGGLK